MKRYHLQKFLLIILFQFVIFTGVFAVPTGENEHPFYFDAVVFNSDNSSGARVDIYSLIPAESLAFEKFGARYGAKYQLFISVYNESGVKIKEESLNGSMAGDDYFIAQGGTGKFDHFQTIFNLPKGKYDIRVLLVDKNSKKEYSRSRTITVLDFADFEFSLSGILLVSSIEEKNSKFTLTPHVNDNIAELEDGFFIFFETYNYTAIDSIDLIYEILDSDNKLKEAGQRLRRKADSGTTRHYLKVHPPSEFRTGAYTLRLLALRTSAGIEYEEKDYLAISQRSIKNIRTIGGKVLEEIDKAIAQLRYCASSDELDYIEEAENDKDKISRFEDFWKKNDPTPNTLRNEAFDEYFSRIETADKMFKSYNQGWLTDKGMVFIIFGPPMQQERFTGYGDGRIYERWLYSDNREFIFADNSGFGDFRLVRPMTVSEKYRYKK